MTSSPREPTVTYLELRESTSEGDAAAGLSHTSKGLVLLHVLELAADGEPRGAVTIVHDAGEHGGRYLDLARELAGRGWAVALPDLRGHGRSEGERGHTNGVREIVRDLGDVQDHLAYRQPDAPKVLVGMGLGALWCLAYACGKPEGVSALVCCAPLLEPRFELPERAGGLSKLWKKTGPTSPGRTGWRADALTRDAAAGAAWGSDPLVHGIVTLRTGEEASATAARCWPRAASLPMPVLVLAGTADRIGGDASGLRSAPVELIPFPEARHDLFHDTVAREATGRLADWLDAKLPRASEG